MGWLCRKWHKECPGTPPAPLHSRSDRAGPQPLRAPPSFCTQFGLINSQSFSATTGPTIKLFIQRKVKCAICAMFKTNKEKRKTKQHSIAFLWGLKFLRSRARPTGRWPCSSSSGGRVSPDTVTKQSHNNCLQSLLFSIQLINYFRRHQDQ